MEPLKKITARLLLLSFFIMTLSSGTSQICHPEKEMARMTCCEEMTSSVACQTECITAIHACSCNMSASSNPENAVVFLQANLKVQNQKAGVHILAALPALHSPGRESAAHFNLDSGRQKPTSTRKILALLAFYLI